MKLVCYTLLGWWNFGVLQVRALSLDAYLTVIGRHIWLSVVLSGVPCHPEDTESLIKSVKLNLWFQKWNKSYRNVSVNHSRSDKVIMIISGSFWSCFVFGLQGGGNWLCELDETTRHTHNLGFRRHLRVVTTIKMTAIRARMAPEQAMPAITPVLSVPESAPAGDEVVDSLLESEDTPTPLISLFHFLHTS